MKEATGELNVTVVVVAILGVLIALFYNTIWPLIKANLNSTTKCSKAICACPDGQNKCEYAECHLEGSNETFRCVYKG